MLPGDFIAFKLCGDVRTTPSGLSEAMLWDCEKQEVAQFVLDYFEQPRSIWPEITANIGQQGIVHREAAQELGINAGIPVSYRAGDQCNNALSLGVLKSGELAATAGTSGVVFGVSDKPRSDLQEKVNTFLHCNSTESETRYGTLLCINGCGCAYSWLRRMLSQEREYQELDSLAHMVSPGSEGLMFFPFGNGAERVLNGENIGAGFKDIDFARHGLPEMCRAVQEGICFAMQYGLDRMREMGIKIDRVRAGNANMFLSPVFVSTLAHLSMAQIDIVDTDGAQGAALGAGLGAQLIDGEQKLIDSIHVLESVEPQVIQHDRLKTFYGGWKDNLEFQLENRDE